MSAQGELLAEWIGDLRGALERQLGRTPDATLHWRPARETNSIADTVWPVARWLDLVTIAALRTLYERQASG